VAWIGPADGIVSGQDQTGQARTEASSSQFAIPDSTLVKSEIEQWMSNAKKSIESRNFDLAETAIGNAEQLLEKLGADPGLAYTPAQARAEMATLRKTTVISESDALRILVAARQSLATGELEQASKLVEQARNNGFAYPPNGDTPERVAKMIKSHQDLVQLTQNGDTQSYNNKTPRFLLQQASVLIQYRDFQTAKMLAEQAKLFETTYNNGETTPDQLLASVSQVVGKTKVDNSKTEAMQLIAQAKLAMDKGQLPKAQQLTAQAVALNVPDSAFASNEMKPWQFELQVRDATRRVDNAVQQAGFNNVQQNNFQPTQSDVVNADYDSTKDITHNAQVSHTTDTEVPPVTTGTTEGKGMSMYRSGVAAVEASDPKQALEYFQMAWQYREELDPGTQQAVQEQLQRLQSGTPSPAQFDRPNSRAESIGESEKEMFRSIQSKVLRERPIAERMMNNKNPRGALQHLNALRREVETSALAQTSKSPLLKLIDRDLEKMEKYISQNMAQIESDEENQQRMERVVQTRTQRYESEKALQRLIDDFNRLMDEGRHAEAEVLARQAIEIAPENEIVEMMQWKAKFVRRQAEQANLRAQKEEGFIGQMFQADKIGIGFDDSRPYRLGNDWASLRERRTAFGSGSYSSESEARIWNILKNQTFQGEFNREPLSEVIRRLSQATGVNMLFDNKALADLRIASDTPIDQQIFQPISIESVLNIILNDAKLVFVVEDEVVKITNAEYKTSKLTRKEYYVGDLVMPVPNFTTPMQMSFMTPFNNTPVNTIASGQNGVPLSMAPGMGGGMAPSTQSIAGMAMAQQLPNSPLGAAGFGGYAGNPYGPQTGMPMYNTMGPTQLGGITAADFTELIQLIQNTIQPDTWSDVEGNGTIRAYPSTLTLIVNQSQEVQDEIQDLLKKLRELNDVQIVIEVRFITLQDDFFERVGIDFDFRINDNTGLASGNLQDNTQPSAIVGRDADPAVFQPTQDLDLPFTQNSSGSAFAFATGNPDLGAAANFGFAILSDIEVFFLIQAVKGDQRTNVTQAPIVTMFNGQVASVNDGATRPFVTSVTPVVGDFAVAHQPIITLLPEGSFLNVQATVSADRQYVRMSLVPFFSQIDNVETFTFNGSTTTRRSSVNDSSDNNADDLLDRILNDTEEETTNTGTTIQLPTVSFTNVSTTVSVPDGGTILLGGVKRLSEGRIERGVPFLSNIPFANRLFKNVGIGRETQSLMLMVTPRIIIQAEEELLQVGDVGGN